MLPVSRSCAMKTALPHKGSNTLANAPLTNPRVLSKLRVSRINTPFTATMPKLDFEDGSQRYPESNCSSVMPIVRSAASHTSDAPLLVHVSHMKLVFFSLAICIPRFTQASSVYADQWRSPKYSCRLKLRYPTTIIVKCCTPNDPLFVYSVFPRRALHEYV